LLAFFDELAKKGLNLLTHYTSLVPENAEKFKAFSNYIVADAYFRRRPIVNAVKLSGTEFIGRLRNDSTLMKPLERSKLILPDPSCRILQIKSSFKLRLKSEALCSV